MESKKNKPLDQLISTEPFSPKFLVGSLPFDVFPRSPSRLFFECFFFCKDYCCSKGLQSTIPGDHSFNGRFLDFQGFLGSTPWMGVLRHGSVDP